MTRNLLLQLKENSFWKKNHSPIWSASSFLIRRNLAQDFFPKQISREDSFKVLEVLKESLLNLSILRDPFFLDLNHLTAKEKDFLMERFLTTLDRSNVGDQSGCVLDRSGTFLAMINGDDHLTLYSIASDLEWKAVWEKLCLVETSLAKDHSFAYSNQFGYLTSSLSHLGTALITQAFLHLPCLIALNQIDRNLGEFLSKEVQAYGFLGTDDFVGHMMIIQNRFTLGLSEQDILKEVHQTATKLLSEEKQARVKLKAKPNALILDKVSRSIGLLKHAYQIDTKEALSAISFVKLGMDLGWVQRVKQQEIDALFFELGRGYLVITSKKELSQKQVFQKRADYLKKVLKSMTMCL